MFFEERDDRCARQPRAFRAQLSVRPSLGPGKDPHAGLVAARKWRRSVVGRIEEDDLGALDPFLVEHARERAGRPLPLVARDDHDGHGGGVMAAARTRRSSSARAGRTSALASDSRVRRRAAALGRPSPASRALLP